MIHIPVLKKEVLQYLDPKPNQNFIDCTAGEGGHLSAILEKTAPQGKVLAIDHTPEILKRIKPHSRLITVCDNFVNLKKIVEQEKVGPIQGILFDLGISSWHLEESKRGFSFLKDEELDMRHNPSSQRTKAQDLINQQSATEIERILKDYGEEPFARNIAQNIVKQRPLETTFQLVKIIKESVPEWYRRRRIHYATRTFQALRIAVNQELANLEEVLPQAQKVLASKGKLVIISFHSLEDRIIKNFFRNQAKEGLLKIITKKPIIASQEEKTINPRARSAKLRVAIKP